MSAKRIADPAAAPARRKRRSSEEIMNKLLSGAAAEFAENGYSGTTTSAIARRGEVTEAQLFRYFPTKAALFREAIFKPMSEHIGRFNREAMEGAWGDTDRDHSKRYIAELQDFLRQHSRMLLSLMVARAYESETHAAPGMNMNSLDRYFERGATVLAERLGRNSGIAPALTVRVSFAALLACVLLDDWLFPEGLATREEIDDAIVTFIINGITPGQAAGMG